MEAIGVGGAELKMEKPRRGIEFVRVSAQRQLSADSRQQVLGLRQRGAGAAANGPRDVHCPGLILCSVVRSSHCWPQGVLQPLHRGLL